MKIAIIGSGIFGLTIALRLSEKFDVTIFDSNPEIMNGATLANHNRHHDGYHYPRSKQTIEQCLRGKESFEKFFPNVIRNNFPNYYAISNVNSKTNFDTYCKIFNQYNLEFKSVDIPNIFNKKKIEGCIITKEGVYDYNHLKKTILNKLNSSYKKIDIRLNSYVKNIEINNYKIVEYLDLNINEFKKLKFDIVIDCSYKNSNTFLKITSQTPKNLQFNLQELAVIEIKNHETFGATIMDGMFPSILPYGHSNKYLFAHAELSQLIRKITSSDNRILNDVNYIKSNWSEIKKTSEEFLPVLKNAEYIYSLFVERVVDYSKKDSDSRISEITYCGNKCWSIFSAKVITCVDIANKLCDEIEMEI